MAAEMSVETTTTDQPVRLTHIHSTRDETQADLIRSALQAVGIETFRTTNEGAGFFSRAVQVDIVVRDSDADEAQSMLRDMDIELQPVLPGDAFAHTLVVREGLVGRFYRHPVVFWLLVIGLIAGFGLGIGRAVARAGWFGG